MSKVKAALFEPKTWLYLAISGLGLLALYFITRLPNLTAIPIFTDEAIYLRWAQIGLSDPRWRFISLTDGKQPLLIWLFLPALKLVSNPLLAGRLVSVLLGAVGMLGLSALGYLVTRTYKGFIIGGLLYIVLPFFLVYDRLAIYEALLLAITIWSLLLTYILGKTLRFDVALILGAVVGAGLLTKSSAQFSIYLLPVSLLLIDWERKQIKKQFLTWLGLAAVIFFHSQIYDNIQRLSEFRHTIAAKNLSFIYSFSEILQSPFKYAIGNNNGLFGWLVAYMTIPFLLLILAAIIWNFRKNWKETIFFASYFFVPYVALAVFGKVIYPRFLIFMIPPLLVLVTRFLTEKITEYKGKPIFYGISLIVIVPLLLFDAKILFDPIHAPFPTTDHNQFINDWPSGWGINEVVTFLQQESEHGEVVIGTEGTFGLFPMALELYLVTNKQVIIKPFWPVNEVPEELRIDARTRPVYLVFKERQDIPANWPLVLVQEHRRGDSQTFLRLYRVLP